MPGTSGDSVNAEQDTRQENYSRCCWKVQEVEGCRQEWGSVLPAVRENSTLKINQLKTVHLFFKQKITFTGVDGYLSGVCEGSLFKKIEELPVIFSSHL